MTKADCMVNLLFHVLAKTQGKFQQFRKVVYVRAFNSGRPIFAVA
jgi:hypothetical protein